MMSSASPASIFNRMGQGFISTLEAMARSTEMCGRLEEMPSPTELLLNVSEMLGILEDGGAEEPSGEGGATVILDPAP